MRLRAFLQASALAGVTVSAVLACENESSPPSNGSDTLVDASARDTGANVPVDSAPPEVNDGAALDAYHESGLAEREPPPGELAACNSFPLAVCNFDGVCPPIAAIINGGGGGPGSSTIPDAGPDGSTAFHVQLDAGGLSGFGMPYFDFYAYQGVSIDAPSRCQVVCEANMRVAYAPTGTTIVSGNIDKYWTLDTSHAGYTHRSGTLSAEHDSGASTDWFHVRIQLLPDGDGGARSTLTVVNAADASTTTTLPVSKFGNSVVFGAFGAQGPTEVFLDDVTCQVSDLP